MRLRYVLNGISPKNKMLCVGDLLRYYGEAKYKTQEALEKIARNRGLSSMLVNSLRKHTSMTGLTVDSLLTAIETSAKFDVFSFEVDGADIAKLVKNNGNTVIEVEMHPMYFNTKASLTMYMPGIGKKRSFDVVVDREKDTWVRWFEKELNNYCPLVNCKKTVLEE